VLFEPRGCALGIVLHARLLVRLLQALELRDAVDVERLVSALDLTLSLL
jgi:hypothetical protein